MLVFICFSLSFVNLYAYYKCLKDHEDKLRNIMGRMRQSIQRIRGSIAGKSDGEEDVEEDVEEDESD